MSDVKNIKISDVKISVKQNKEIDSEENTKPENTTDAKVAQVNPVDVEGETLDSCENVPVDPCPLTERVIAKVPVLLAEFTVKFKVSSVIELPGPALEIKSIKKKVKITQCLLLQNTNVLFIKGFVRKNIDYSTRTSSSSEGVCGDIRHCTVDVPFECTTDVTFNGTQPKPVINNRTNEFQYYKVDELPNEFAEKDKLLSSDLSEFNQTSVEYFNELPYCELIRSRIVEFDEYLNRTQPNVEIPFEEKEFTEVEEKMVIFLTLKLLQKRQVRVGRDC